jgi:hypothetical protein
MLLRDDVIVDQYLPLERGLRGGLVHYRKKGGRAFLD